MFLIFFSFVHLQEQLASLTEVSAEKQLILLGDIDLTAIVQTHDQVQTYPKFVQKQLFLFEKENTEPSKPVVPKLRK